MVCVCVCARALGSQYSHMIVHGRHADVFTCAHSACVCVCACVSPPLIQVDAYHEQTLTLLQSQLSKLSVSYTPCIDTTQRVVELRNEVCARWGTHTHMHTQTVSQLHSLY